MAWGVEIARCKMLGQGKAVACGSGRVRKGRLPSHVSRLTFDDFEVVL